jgi:hypothetical protein
MYHVLNKEKQPEHTRDIIGSNTSIMALTQQQNSTNATAADPTYNSKH